MENSNTRADLERIKNQVLQHLQQLPPVPSVPVAVMPPATKVRARGRSGRRELVCSLLLLAAEFKVVVVEAGVCVSVRHASTLLS